jgi:FAD/FMN-containing dehydrogenase/Fe-S oxidoreductase
MASTAGESVTPPREIPFNYTSADDAQVVRIILGEEARRTLDRLRGQRVTGRSAKLLLRVIGELFLLRRNPYLLEEIVGSRARLRPLRKAVERDLEMVRRGADGNPEVLSLLGLCQIVFSSFLNEVESLALRRAVIRRELGAVVGPENVLFDPFSVISHATDATDWRLYLPLAVVRPSREDQIGPLVRSIAALGLKIIPRGGGTGLTGGAVPTGPDCVMINTEKLNRIAGVRHVPQVGNPSAAPVPVLEVESGVITEDAIHAASDAGWVFATDPTSAWASTIGGNIAENAGGKMAVLWGTAIDNIFSFRIVMPDGRHWSVHRVDHPLRKILPGDAVTFQVWNDQGRFLRAVKLTSDEIRKPGLWKDITNKALGGIPGLQKEGTDGIITSAQFVLHRPYARKATFCLEFFGENMEEAGRVILQLADAFPNLGKETLMALEHFDNEYVRAIHYKTKAARDDSPRAVILVDMVAHTDEQLSEGTLRLHDIMTRHPNSSISTAQNRFQAETFWADRKKLGAIARRTNAFKLNEDVVLPLDRIAEYSRYLDDVNVAEEKHSHGIIAERIAALVAGEAAASKDDALAAKLPATRDACTAMLDRAVSASHEALRGGEVVQQFAAALRRLLAGYDPLLARIEKAIADERARLIVVASHMHAGDGNIHVNIPVFSNDREMMRRATTTADNAMRKAVAFGGVVSGEHGIGVTKFHHLDPERVRDLTAYRAVVDPRGVMNPGKLFDPLVPANVFTPSFNLLELEARILRHGQLESLADKVAQCVRCGKCKPDCCVFYPAANMFYHPRNKNLAIGAIAEALLYDAQRHLSLNFGMLRYLSDVADHCTVCHKCLAPCPADIDTGEVSLLERDILRAFGQKKTPVITELTLRYLQSRSVAFNALFRMTVLRWGSRLQRLGAAAMRLAPDLPAIRKHPAAMMLRSRTATPSKHAMHRDLPRYNRYQALLLKPAVGTPAKTVFYFPGCGSERLHADIGKASVYLLLKTGIQVVLPPPSLCCGFPLKTNAKSEEHNRKVLANTIIFSQIREMFRYLSFDACVVSCGTCIEELEHTGLAEIFEAPLEDVSGYVVRSGLQQGLSGSYAYHRPCHDSLKGDAHAVIAAGDDVTLTSVPNCCSEAGTMSLSRPDITDAMLRRKTEAFSTTQGLGGAKAILTNCPSCVSGLQRNAGKDLPPRHLAVEIARSIGGTEWQKEFETMTASHEIVNC